MFRSPDKESQATIAPSNRLGAVTRKKNEIVPLMVVHSEENYRAVKQLFTEYLVKVETFIMSCNKYVEQPNVDKVEFEVWFSKQTTEISDFRSKVESYLAFPDSRRQNVVKSPSEDGSTLSDRSSKRSTSSSARIRLAAQKAKLAAEKQFLHQNEELEVSRRKEMFAREKAELEVKHKQIEQDKKYEIERKKIELAKTEIETTILEEALNAIDRGVQSVDGIVEEETMQTSKIQPVILGVSRSEKEITALQPNPFENNFARDVSFDNAAQLTRTYGNRAVNKERCSPYYDNPQPYSVQPQQVTETRIGIDKLTDILEQQNMISGLFARNQEMACLPKKEVETFDGQDLTKFPSFLRNFTRVIEASCESAEDRFYYLKQYTSGGPHEVVCSCDHYDSEIGYAEAKKLLIQEYGNEYKIAQAYLTRLDQWPIIKQEDGHALQALSLFLLSISNYMEKMTSLNQLNSWKEIACLVKKLPFKCRERWRHVTLNLQEHNRPIVFADFVSFVRTQSALVNQPLFGDIQDQPIGKIDRTTKRPYTKTRSLATSTTPKESNDCKLFCPCCKMRNHVLNDCKFFHKKILKECIDFVKANKLCFGCLREGHSTKGCYARLTCRKCNNKHPTCLHDERKVKGITRPMNSSEKTCAAGNDDPGRNPSTPLFETMDNTDASISMQISCSTGASIGKKRKIACPMIPIKVRINGIKKLIFTYAALDAHSSDNFIKEDLLETLGIRCLENTICLTTLEGRNRQAMVKVVSNIEVSDLDGNGSVILPVTYARKVWPFSVEDVPRPEDVIGLSDLKHIPFRYIASKEAEVGLLIGMIHPDILKPLEIVDAKSNGTYASRHLLGWALNGPICSDQNKGKNVYCHRIKLEDKDEIESKIEHMYKLDFLDTNLDEIGISVEDLKWEIKVKKSIKLLEDGHYEIELPFRNNDVSFPSNREQIKKQFEAQVRRLSKEELYRKDYIEFMKMMMDNGFMEEVPELETTPESGKVWYIAHHGVYHKVKKKIRVVFNCSLKYMCKSLNTELLEGPNLINNLIGILIRFRQGKIAVQADVEKMFYQVKVPVKHRNFMRFFWFKGNDFKNECIEYRLTRHVFGAASSPSIANFALRQTSFDNHDYPEEVKMSVRKDFYVDDYLKSVDGIQEAETNLHAVRNLVAKGGFNLTGFISNSRELLQRVDRNDLGKNFKNLDLTQDKLPYERALGVVWKAEKDSFSFKINLPEQPVTRRGILSTIFSIYDPLNIAAPILIRAKHIFQETCRLKLQWDDELPAHIADNWITWVKEIPSLMQYEIPRCYLPHGNPKKIELHYFSDGSEIAYGIVVYIRFILQNDDVHCSLMIAKSRLTPLNNTTLKTIPRIELNAARLSVQMQQTLHRELDLKIDSEYFWTDSTAVLNYINNETRRFQRFVCNRVTVIRSYTRKDQWKYVPSRENPADLITRGITISKFIREDKWKNGPSFLFTTEDNWPVQITRSEICEADPEVKKEVIVFTTRVHDCNATDQLIESSSSWYKLKCKVAWMLRIKICLKTKTWDKSKMTVDELEKAEMAILHYIQGSEFKQAIESLESGKQLKGKDKLAKLHPFLDEKGILRVGGRIDKAKISYAVKHPIILHKNSHVAKILIKEAHQNVGHLGRESTIAEVRQKYWIIGVNTITRKLIRECIQCRRCHGKPSEQLMAELPEERLTYDVKPFTNTAVDFFGPFYVTKFRKSEKRYGVIFSCLASRSVHLEVAYSLDTSSFICALRRFVARRGDVRRMRSDNGTNFVGSNRELKEAIEHWNVNNIESWTKQHGIDWSFQPPASSHHGGVFEREIRTIRNVLNALMNEQPIKATDETFHTLLCEVESILNGRPLTALSSDPNDLEALTPNHILLLKSGVTFPPGLFDQSDLFVKKRWRQVQYLADLFWRRWQREYLPLLQSRQKWTKDQEPHAVGDLVLIKDTLLPRNQWNLGRISEVHKDRHGRVRSTKIRIAKFRDKCKTGVGTIEIERPIVKLILLKSITEF